MIEPRELVGTPSKRKCPGSFSNLGGPAPATDRNAPSLRRWKAIWDALAAELGSGVSPTPPERQFDPVQASIVAAQIRGAKPLLSSLDPGEIDLQGHILAAPVRSEELRVFFQFERVGRTGLLELYKLKTARVKGDDEFATSPEERAVVVTDPRFPDEMEAYEIRTSDGEMIRLEMPRRHAEKALSDLARDYQEMASSEPVIVAGAHCSTCKVADLCDTFPAMDPVPLSKRLPSASRLMISKSRLPEIEYCQRRVAWKVLFAIPPDSDHDRGGISHGLELGNRFHSLMAQALLSEDPASFFSGDCEAEALYRRHLTLPCVDDLTVRTTEFPLGFSTRFRTSGSPVSVVLYGIADAVGREADGTPAVIDHKTGVSPRTRPLEAELYALGAFLRIGGASEVATHIHRLPTSGGDPVCDRQVWRRDQVTELAERLGGLAETAAGWDKMDALSPPYQTGEWCGTCPYENRCSAYR